MMDQPKVSNAFQLFMSEAPGHAQAWMKAIEGLDQASALDKKTEELAYIAVMAAMRLESGIPFHVQMAKNAGTKLAEAGKCLVCRRAAEKEGVTIGGQKPTI